jgi:hypothetical protein
LHQVGVNRIGLTAVHVMSHTIAIYVSDSVSVYVSVSVFASVSYLSLSLSLCLCWLNWDSCMQWCWSQRSSACMVLFTADLRLHGAVHNGPPLSWIGEHSGLPLAWSCSQRSTAILHTRAGSCFYACSRRAVVAQAGTVLPGGRQATAAGKPQPLAPWKPF